MKTIRSIVVGAVALTALAAVQPAQANALGEDGNSQGQQQVVAPGSGGAAEPDSIWCKIFKTCDR